MNENLLGNYITMKRTTKGLSLRGMAAKAQISPSQLSKIESGIATNPTDETLEKIAYALNEDKDALFALAGKVPQDAIIDAVYYLPKIRGGEWAINEIAASYVVGHCDEVEETPNPQFNVLFGLYEGRESFVATILEAVASEHPKMSNEDIIQIVKEMIAAHDMTMRRTKGRKPGKQ
ncbi:helix-turn-helix domain-containing protein [Paenibacillus sp. Marseille-Q9583]